MESNREQGLGVRAEETPLTPNPSVLLAKRLLFWGCFVGLFVVDQIVKAWVRNNLRLEESLAWWPGVFELRRTYNKGIAFGLLSGKGVFLTPIAVVIAAGAAWYVYKHPRESRWNHAAFGLLGAGAVGNLYDRIVAHQVTDMFWFRLIDFPVFNVADACITVATIMLMIGWWREAAEKGGEGRRVAGSSGSEADSPTPNDHRTL